MMAEPAPCVHTTTDSAAEAHLQHGGGGEQSRLQEESSCSSIAALCPRPNHRIPTTTATFRKGFDMKLLFARKTVRVALVRLILKKTQLSMNLRISRGRSCSLHAITALYLSLVPRILFLSNRPSVVISSLSSRRTHTDVFAIVFVHGDQQSPAAATRRPHPFVLSTSLACLRSPFRTQTEGNNNNDDGEPASLLKRKLGLFGLVSSALIEHPCAIAALVANNLHPSKRCALIHPATSL